MSFSVFPKRLACASALTWAISSPVLATDEATTGNYLEVSARASVGVDYLSNIDKRATGGTISNNEWRRGGNDWGTSLLDIKGAHNIGSYAGLGQVKAIFLIESGFDSDKREFNGNTALNRRAYVGVQSSTLGSIIVGKNLSLAIDTYYIDPFYQQFDASETLVRGRSWQAVDNMVGYTSPTWAGWTAQLQAGLGGETGKFRGDRSEAASINYIGPTVTFYTIYDLRHDGDGRYSSLFLNSRELVTGAKIHLGRWDLFGGYNRLDAPDAVPVSQGGDGFRRADHSWLGAQWWVTPNWRLQGAMFHIDVDNGGGSANLPVIGTTYNFTKDFMIYATYGRVVNSSNAEFSAEATDERPAPGRSQNSFYFGFIYTLDKVFGHP